jgi:hypothetical protein
VVVAERRKADLEYVIGEAERRDRLVMEKNDFIKTYHGWSFIGSDESCHNNDNDSGKDDSHGRAHPEIPKLLYRRGAFESLVWFEDRWMVASWCDE